MAFEPWLFVWVKNMEKKNGSEHKTVADTQNLEKKKNNTNNINVSTENKNIQKNNINAKKKDATESKARTKNENNINIKKTNIAEDKANTKSENNINAKKKNATESKADTKTENNINTKKKKTNTKKSAEPVPEMKKETENTGQRQKHWTQLNREYRLRRQGIYVEEQSYREIPKKIDLPLNGCGFGDEYFLFAGPDGSPKYEDPNLVWDSFIDWLEKLCKRYKKYKDTTRQGEYFLGQELIVHASQRNLYKIYCYISLNWVGFRDGFLLQKGCPEIVIEFVRGVLANKMTEKQMWGTVDDRCPGGTVIVFDEELMPKEGEDTGTIKFEYHPNFVEERMGKMKRSNGML